MRGPLLSGALGSPATLGRVLELVREHSPVVVLSALWLAETLSSELPVLALIEEDKHGAAMRARRRAQKQGLPLSMVIAAAEVPLAKSSVGTVLVDSLVDIEEESAAIELLAGLAPLLKADGRVLSLNTTKTPALEARVAEIFLAASLSHVTQMRPRDGALLTMGTVPPPAVVAARLRASASNG
jgi:hypothetical protein